MRKALSLLRKGGSICDALIDAKVPGGAFAAWEDLGFSKKVRDGKRFRCEIPEPDSETMELLIEAAWSAKKKNNHLPPSPTPNPFPSIPASEEIAQLLAKIGNVLHIQFNRQSPPGAYQHTIQLQQELKQLRERNVVLERKLKQITSAIGRVLPEDEQSKL